MLWKFGWHERGIKYYDYRHDWSDISSEDHMTGVKKYCEKIVKALWLEVLTSADFRFRVSMSLVAG